VHRLENIFSCLRKLLRPPSGGESLLHSSLGKKTGGPSYGLEAYPKLWVNTDALTWQVEQTARMERFGDDALPYWERAIALLKRGPFLADEAYEAYAYWIKEQRDKLEGYGRQCVHALSRLYLASYGERGKTEALLLLRTYWQQHKTDEDALRPLLELLGEQERYQEAEEYYQQLLTALAELGSDEEGKPHQLDPRTCDVREYLCARQIRRSSSSSHIHVVRRSSGAISTKPQIVIANMSSPLQRLDHGTLTPSIEVPAISQTEENVRDWSTWFGSKLAQLITVVDHWLGQAISCDHLQALLDQEILGFDIMKPLFNDGAYLHSRRQALITIATLPVALWTSVQQGITSASMTEKLLTRCAANITSLWHLLKGSELSFIEQTLSTYVLTLVTLAQQPSPYQKTAARLASQTYRLYGIIALHRNNLKARENYCQQALYFSEIAENASLVVSAYISLASTFYYEKNPVKAAQIYLKALKQEEEIFPLQCARLYAELAVVFAWRAIHVVRGCP
jgi:DNA-binding SARP family transcriptional activator